MTKIILIIVVVIGAVVWIATSKSPTWQAMYETPNSYAIQVEKPFSSKEYCLSWLRNFKANYPQSYNLECGRDCTFDGNIYVCKETAD